MFDHLACLTGLLHRTLETSAPLAYAIWFVVAVFTSVMLHVRDPTRSRAEGVRALTVNSTTPSQTSHQPIAADQDAGMRH